MSIKTGITLRHEELAEAVSGYRRQLMRYEAGATTIFIDWTPNGMPEANFGYKNP
jgi:hypothetical protein